MPFSISGRIAQGADEALEQVLDRRMKEAIRLQNEQHQKAQLDLQRETLAGANADRLANQGFRERQINLQELGRKDKLEATQRELADKATAKNAMGDMAAVLQMPGLSDKQRTNEIMGSGLRTNTVDPMKVIENLNKVPTKPTLHQVTIPGPHGPITKWIGDEEAQAGVQEYVKPDRAPRENLSPGQKFQATRALRNDYVRETGAAKTITEQLAQMKSSMTAVNEGKAAAGSQGVLVTFQKILDPTSVVRESEYARSASGQSLMNQIQGQWDRIQAGGVGVPKEELKKFVDLAERFAANSVRSAKETRKQIDAIAQEFELNPDNITRDYDFDEEHGGGAGGGGGGGGNQPPPPGGGGGAPRLNYSDLFPKPPG